MRLVTREHPDLGSVLVICSILPSANPHRGHWEGTCVLCQRYQPLHRPFCSNR